jgi:hypothetical protein
MLVLERKRRVECWKNNTNHGMFENNHCWVEFHAENEAVGLRALRRLCEHF